ncbi:protein-arginine deiminase family protein [Actinocrispum sp. NPDC049592]|uniref:protein-arginine deiminase family protein n=1 Tax=Actinocrispum sp. NPDC049592 TaxID=3154835 RepID=UPI00342D95D5
MTGRTLFVLAAVSAGVTGFAPAASADIVQFRADAPVFLANIDDDAGVCKARAVQAAADAIPREQADDEAFNKRREELVELAKTDPVGAEQQFQELQRTHRLSEYQAEREMAACNDAADTVVNGPQDEKDLTRLHAWSPWGAGKIAVPPQVHVFVKRQTWELVKPSTQLSADELRHGVTLGVEGVDVIRDTKVWDGKVTLKLTVGDQTSTVDLREAPVVMQNNTQRVQDVLIADQRSSDAAFDKAMAGAVNQPLHRVNTSGDDWMQDVFEPAYMSIPGSSMRVLIPSVNNSRRIGARTAWTEFAGPDVAAIHVPHAFTLNEHESLDSMGNLETVPPRPGSPLGRIIVGEGEPGEGPAPEMLTFLRSQGVQNPLVLDTSWLDVGHVDEFIQFLPAPGSRLGWKAAVADPRLGLQLLRNAGHRDQIMHGDLPPLEWPYDLHIETRTIGEFLADEQFVRTNENAAAKIDANVAKLGLTEADIVRVPGLFSYKSLDWNFLKQDIDQMQPGPERDKKLAELHAMTTAIAEIPNAVNGLVLNGAESKSAESKSADSKNGRYIAPKPYGPIINGKDIFADAISKAFQGIGLQVKYVDDLLGAHFSGGDIHCVTNTLRTLPTP